MFAAANITVPLGSVAIAPTSVFDAIVYLPVKPNWGIGKLVKRGAGAAASTAGVSAGTMATVSARIIANGRATPNILENLLFIDF